MAVITGGRGQDVTEFGDYFRTMKWNQGPGNDQPRLASNIIKSKVSASIAHLYRRPPGMAGGFLFQRLADFLCGCGRCGIP